MSREYCTGTEIAGVQELSRSMATISSMGAGRADAADRRLLTGYRRSGIFAMNGSGDSEIVRTQWGLRWD
jgi:hypothetical protein